MEVIESCIKAKNSYDEPPTFVVVVSPLAKQIVIKGIIFVILNDFCGQMYLFQASKYTYEPPKYTYDKLYL